MYEYTRDINQLNRSLYFSLYDHIKEGTAIIETHSKKVIYCNKTFLHLFGFGGLAEVDLGQLRKLRKVTLSDDDIAARIKAIEANGYYSELVEYISLQGISFFGEVTYRLAVNDDVHYYLLIVTKVDKSFFDHASIGIVMINKGGDIVTVNPYLMKQFGYQQNELIGKKIELLIPERFHSNHLNHRKKSGAMQPEMGVTMDKKVEFFGVKNDGTEFPVEVSLGIYPSDSEEYIIAFVTDISTLKRAEQNLKELVMKLGLMVKVRTNDLTNTMTLLEKSKEELQKTIAFQKAILDSTGAIICSVDNAGIIQTFNKEGEKLLGYIASELIGKHTPLIFHDPVQLKRRSKEYTAQLQCEPLDGIDLLLAKTRHNLENIDEWIFVRKDGSTFFVRLKISAVKNEQEAIIGFVGVAIDISKTKEFQFELQKSLEKEKELNSLKSRFVSLASHEFRTPLSTILSSHYLIEKYTLTAEQPKREVHLKRILESVNLLSDMLNDFLSVGKIEEGKVNLNITRFNIEELVSSMADEARMTLKANQSIVYLHKGDPYVLLDISFIKHIFLNLVSNASKFSPEGSLIQIKTKINNSHLTLCVKDNGIGIPQEDQEHLMDRFFRASNAGNIQGTGLGLHIVAKYAEMMNGTVRFKSELGKGAEFIVTFNL